MLCHAPWYHSRYQIREILHLCKKISKSTRKFDQETKWCIGEQHKKASGISNLHFPSGNVVVRHADQQSNRYDGTHEGKSLWTACHVRQRTEYPTFARRFPAWTKASSQNKARKIGLLENRVDFPRLLFLKHFSLWMRQAKRSSAIGLFHHDERIPDWRGASKLPHNGTNNLQAWLSQAQPLCKSPRWVTKSRPLRRSERAAYLVAAGRCKLARLPHDCAISLAYFFGLPKITTYSHVVLVHVRLYPAWCQKFTSAKKQRKSHLSRSGLSHHANLDKLNTWSV